MLYRAFAGSNDTGRYCDLTCFVVADDYAGARREVAALARQHLRDYDDEAVYNMVDLAEMVEWAPGVPLRDRVLVVGWCGGKPLIERDFVATPKAMAFLESLR